MCGRWKLFARPEYSPRVMAIAAGTRLGPYEIQSPLGAGGMGEVYRAGDTRLERRGGAQARWRSDGNELFYISGDKKLMSVSIDTSHGKLVAGVPRMLFQTRIIAPRIVLFQYAVAPDGKRFLINSLPPVGATPLTILTN
jgi:serine/threonine protein kinase